MCVCVFGFMSERCIVLCTCCAASSVCPKNNTSSTSLYFSHNIENLPLVHSLLNCLSLLRWLGALSNDSNALPINQLRVLARRFFLNLGLLLVSCSEMLWWSVAVHDSHFNVCPHVTLIAHVTSVITNNNTHPLFCFFFFFFRQHGRQSSTAAQAKESDVPKTRLPSLD